MLTIQNISFCTTGMPLSFNFINFWIPTISCAKHLNDHLNDKRSIYHVTIMTTLKTHPHPISWFKRDHILLITLVKVQLEACSKVKSLIFSQGFKMRNINLYSVIQINISFEYCFKLCELEFLSLSFSRVVKNGGVNFHLV